MWLVRVSSSSATGSGSSSTASALSLWSSLDDDGNCSPLSSSFDSQMIDGCRLDDGVEAAGECWSLADVRHSSAGLSVAVNLTDTGGVERQATRGPRSDRLRSIGRGERPRRSDCEAVGCGGGDVDDSTSAGTDRSDSGGPWRNLDDDDDEVRGAALSPAAVSVCRFALYISISTSSFASMSSTFRHQQQLIAVNTFATYLSIRQFAKS